MPPRASRRSWRSVLRCSKDANRAALQERHAPLGPRAAPDRASPTDCGARTRRRNAEVIALGWVVLDIRAPPPFDSQADRSSRSFRALTALCHSGASLPWPSRLRTNRSSRPLSSRIRSRADSSMWGISSLTATRHASIRGVNCGWSVWHSVQPMPVSLVYLAIAQAGSARQTIPANRLSVTDSVQDSQRWSIKRFQALAGIRDVKRRFGQPGNIGRCGQPGQSAPGGLHALARTFHEGRPANQQQVQHRRLLASGRRVRGEDRSGDHPNTAARPLK